MTKKTCFIISPIGEEDSETRRKANQVLKFIISPVFEETDYEIIRADNIEKTGIITNQIIMHVLNADIVIADLSNKNPNVFYELALRHAARKPLIQIISKGEKIPFDVSAMRTIMYTLDLEGAERAKDEITAFLRSMPKHQIESPVSIAVDFFQDNRTDSDESEIANINYNIGLLLSEMESLRTDAQGNIESTLNEEIINIKNSLETIERTTSDLARNRINSLHKITSDSYSILEYPAEYFLSDLASSTKHRCPWIAELAQEMSIKMFKDEYVDIEPLKFSITKTVELIKENKLVAGGQLQDFLENVNSALNFVSFDRRIDKS